MTSQLIKPATMSRRGFLQLLGITTTTVLFVPESIVTPEKPLFEDIHELSALMYFDRVGRLVQVVDHGVKIWP